MNRSVKVALVAASLVLLLGASILTFAGSHPAASTETENNWTSTRPPENRPPENRPPTRITNCGLEMLEEFLEQGNTSEKLAPNRLQMLKMLLTNATSVEITGEVVALFEGKLVLNTTTGHVTIFLPVAWTLNDTVMRRAQLFNGTFSGKGEEVTVTALKFILFENTSIIINIMFGYEITNAKSATAFALLPFNIEVKP